MTNNFKMDKYRLSGCILLVLNLHHVHAIAPALVLENDAVGIKNLADYPVYDDETVANGSPLSISGNSGDPNRKMAGLWNAIGDIADQISLTTGLSPDISAAKRLTDFLAQRKQQKKTGENFIRFGRKRREDPKWTKIQPYYSLPFPLTSPKVTNRWDTADDCEEIGEGAPREPWIVVSNEPFKDYKKESEGPEGETFIRFGKGVRDHGSTVKREDFVQNKKTRNIFKCKL